MNLGSAMCWKASVRKAGSRVRITSAVDRRRYRVAYLVRSVSMARMADIFDLQDQVTACVVAVIEPKLLDAEIERAKS